MNATYATFGRVIFSGSRQRKPNSMTYGSTTATVAGTVPLFGGAGIAWDASPVFSKILGDEYVAIPASLTGDSAYNFTRNSLADVGLLIIAPFQVEISQLGEDNYVARFCAANAHASGDTADEAITSLKDVIRHLYWRLSTLPDAQLGCAARQQKAVLSRHLTAG
jgi:hypothetical protein